MSNLRHNFTLEGNDVADDVEVYVSDGFIKLAAGYYNDVRIHKSQFAALREMLDIIDKEN